MKLLLLSGGYDSAALAWMEQPALALTIDYGQMPALGEIRASREICAAIGLEHEILRLPCRNLGSGDLAGKSALPLSPSPEWWPFRNQLLLTLAAMRAIQIEAQSIIIGTVCTDSFHGDGRLGFVESFNRMLAEQEGAIRVEAPGIGRSTAELIQASEIPREVLAWCHSCHTGEWACGSCRGCLKALSVRIELGHEQT